MSGVKGLGPAPLGERLARRLVRDDTTGCLVWTGFKNRGYGYIGDGKRSLRVHRAAWELAHGPIPDGLVVCHRCDNPPCCEPSHLFLGTQAENLADCRAKGRHRTGTKYPEETVRLAREMWANGATYAQIQEVLDVAPSYVWHLLSGYTRPGVGGPEYANRRTRHPKESVARARELLVAGHPYAEVLAQTGLPPEYLRTIRSRALRALKES